jgi:hypothetical protein
MQRRYCCKTAQSHALKVQEDQSLRKKDNSAQDMWHAADNTSEPIKKGSLHVFPP